MERDILYDNIKQEALKEVFEYLYIGDFNLDMKVKLLIKMFENAPIVDDSIPDYDRLEKIGKIIVDKKIHNWFGRRIDTDLSQDYVLTTVFDKYTNSKTLEILINSIRNEFKNNRNKS